MGQSDSVNISHKSAMHVRNKLQSIRNEEISLSMRTLKTNKVEVIMLNNTRTPLNLSLRKLLDKPKGNGEVR